MASEKLYIVVRADLPVGLQASQAVHAGQEFARRFPRLARAWQAASNTVVLVTVPDRASVERVLEHAARDGVPAAAFHDADLDPPLTAVALGPHTNARRLCRGFHLLGKSV